MIIILYMFVPFKKNHVNGSAGFKIVSLVVREVRMIGDRSSIESWVGPRACLEVVKRNISSSYRESNPDFSAVQPVA
jgi:hypothetical protein